MRENKPVDLRHTAREQKPCGCLAAGILLSAAVDHADAFFAAADEALPLPDVEHGKAGLRQCVIRAGKPHAARRDEHGCGSGLPELDGPRAQGQQKRKSIEKNRRCDQISVFKIKRCERELCRAPHDQQHQPHRPAERPRTDACRRRKRQCKQRRGQPGTENDREHPQSQHIHDRRCKRDSPKLERRNGQREDHGRDRAAERRQHGAQKRAENILGAQKA